MDIVYAYWETAGGTTPEQNEDNFPTVVAPDLSPGDGVGIGEVTIPSEVK